MPSEATNAATRREWRELGFFYDIDEGVREWRMVGSRSGLLRLRDLLLAYTAEAKHQRLSEHAHYGPYWSLKVMTWTEPALDDHGIRGPLRDLERLARLVQARLEHAGPGSRIRIHEEFASSSSWTLVLEVRSDGFDPSTTDPALSGPGVTSDQAL